MPIDAIPKQIDFALARLEPATAVKLYNSGSFFDPRAIPPEDYEAIASRVASFQRVIVECHPAFVDARCVAFREMINGTLEIAMGLETASPDVLEKLNKRMTLDEFSMAADFLRTNNVDLRVFILVQPPFMKTCDSLYWAQRSLDLAFDCGATAVTLIPTRANNGAMEALAAAGQFAAPGLSLLEEAVAYGLALGRGRVFADVWDMKESRECAICFNARVQRLREINLKQVLTTPVHCDTCS